MILVQKEENGVCMFERSQVSKIITLRGLLSIKDPLMMRGQPGAAPSAL
jgi:hypothetical protein